VAPGTGIKTNPNVMEALRRDTIFTNTGVTPENEPWWEGLAVSRRGIDYLARRKMGSLEGCGGPAELALHRAGEAIPSISPKWEAPEGVPISAFIFGGRRARLAPLVYESFSWQHGVFTGATMASETTAATTGDVGVTRRDPMAMLPFCGYNMADYFQHWLDMGEDSASTEDFHVNWSARRGRKIPVARIWRERARAEVDSGAGGRPRRGQGNADRVRATRTALTLDG